jgi:hypothetical protein
MAVLKFVAIATFPYTQKDVLKVFVGQLLAF